MNPEVVPYLIEIKEDHKTDELTVHPSAILKWKAPRTKGCYVVLPETDLQPTEAASNTFNLGHEGMSIAFSIVPKKECRWTITYSIHPSKESGDGTQNSIIVDSATPVPGEPVTS